MDRPHQININLLERARHRQAGIIYWGLGLWLVIIAIGWSGYFYAEHSRALGRLQAENTVLKSELTSGKRENDRLADLQVSAEEMLMKQQTMDKLQSRKVSYAELISEVDKAIPPPITMVGVETIGSRVILTGFSPGHSQVARLLEGLKKIPTAASINVFLSALDETSNEVKYSIEINWEAEKQ